MAFIAQVSAVANRPLVFNCNKSAIILNPFLKLLKFNYMIKNSGVVYLTEIVSMLLFFLLLQQITFFFHIKAFTLL